MTHSSMIMAKKTFLNDNDQEDISVDDPASSSTWKYVPCYEIFIGLSFANAFGLWVSFEAGGSERSKYNGKAWTGDYLGNVHNTTSRPA